MKRWGLLAVLLLAACAGPMEGEPDPAAVGDTTTDAPRQWSGDTRRVPDDYPTIQAVILLFSFVYVLINLLIDLSYSLLDPRIRY